MRILSLSLPLLLILSCHTCVLAQPKSKKHPAPLFDNLGNHHFPISTKSKQAQRYFDQAMILVYGFNHKEAIRSFEAVAQLDPQCAMAHWGIALALGPNINAPMSEEAGKKAFVHMKKALALAKKASKREQAYIRALSKRYTKDVPKERADLDKAYADEMRKVRQTFPKDMDAATLFAEALMDTTPWNYWEKDGSPRPATKEILEALEFVIANNPNHPGANHYYIHAVEASKNPERGLPSAYRLKTLCPGAGHLVHMPAHIFLKLGMYHEASTANVKAIAADDNYVTACKVQGFYPQMYFSHNAHFLCYSLSMEGRQADCLKAAKMTLHIMKESDAPDIPYMQWLKATPLFADVRFGQWDAILKRKPPMEKNKFESAMYRFARYLARVRKGDVFSSQMELLAVEALLKSADVKELETVEFPGKSVVEVAHTMMRAELAAARDKQAEQIELLEKAVKLEDALPYMEPPFWSLHVRHALGKALLQANRAKEAEAVYRADLSKHPNNGWALFGLLQALRQQGKTSEAKNVQNRFREAWQHADVVLTSSWN